MACESDPGPETAPGGGSRLTERRSLYKVSNSPLSFLSSIEVVRRERHD